MMKYTIFAIAALMLFPASAFAMENDGMQNHPCKNISTLAEKITCRSNMLDERIKIINSKGCQNLTANQCEIAKENYAEQLVLIEKVRTAIESFPDLVPQARKALIVNEIAPALYIMHENCDEVEKMRQR